MNGGVLVCGQVGARRQDRCARHEEAGIGHGGVLGRAQRQLQLAGTRCQQRLIDLGYRHGQHGVARHRRRVARAATCGAVRLARPVDRVPAIGQHLDPRLQQAHLRTLHLGAALHHHEDIDQITGTDTVLRADDFIDRDGDGALARRQMSRQAFGQDIGPHGLPLGYRLAQDVAAHQAGIGHGDVGRRVPLGDLEHVVAQPGAGFEVFFGHHHGMGFLGRRRRALRHLGWRRRRGLAHGQTNRQIAQRQGHQKKEHGGDFGQTVHGVTSCGICTTAQALSVLGNQGLEEKAAASEFMVARSGQVLAL